MVLDDGTMERLESNERRPFSFLLPPHWKKRVDGWGRGFYFDFVGFYSH